MAFVTDIAVAKDIYISFAPNDFLTQWLSTFRTMTVMFLRLEKEKNTNKINKNKTKQIKFKKQEDKVVDAVTQDDLWKELKLKPNEFK